MNIIGTLALLAWTPIVLIASVMWPARWVVPGSLMIGYLFLPVGAIHISGLPDMDKMAIVGIAAIVASIVLDSNRYGRLRFGWFDLPVLVLCGFPLLSAINAGDGVYDGLSAMLRHILVYGLPYTIGRLYCADVEGVRRFAYICIAGGLIYVPLCLWEMRMSPQLHSSLYGYRPGGAATDEGWWGILPHARYQVFIEMSINCVTFMALVAVVFFAVWLGKVRRMIFTMPMWMYCGGMWFMVLLGKVASAVGVGGMGIGTLFIGRWVFVRVMLLAVILAGPGYMGLRLMGVLDSETAVGMIQSIFPGKGYSFGARLENEDIMMPKIMDKPLFGWGSKSGFMSDGVRAVDGYWLILSGKFGFVSLIAWMAVCLLPATFLLLRVPVAHWYQPVIAPAMGLALMTALLCIQNIFNAMFFPPAYAAAGGLMVFLGQTKFVPQRAAAPTRARTAARPRRPRPAPAMPGNEPARDPF